MTPRATTVDEEGVLIDNFLLVDQGNFREEETVKLLTDHKYPCRKPVQNVADLKAQIAANEKGVQELRKMVAHFGLDVVQAYMGHVQDNAAESVRALLLPRDGGWRYLDECRVSAPDQHRHPRRLHAEAEISGGRRCR